LLWEVNRIPYTLILINWLAIAGGAFLIAAWLVRHGVSAWLSLIYAFYPGPIIGLQWDLTEPLSYALVALGIYLFSREGRLRYVFSGLAFAPARVAVGVRVACRCWSHGARALRWNAWLL
jgi:hypothetical protein